MTLYLTKISLRLSIHYKYYFLFKNNLYTFAMESLLDINNNDEKPVAKTVGESTRMQNIEEIVLITT
jgi:hypothetical protein